MLPKLSIILILLLAFSCNEKMVEGWSVLIYKTKHDYINNVSVELSPDKARITSYPSPFNMNLKWPVKLADGYLLHGSIGVNYGFLSLTKEEYSQYESSPGADSLYKLLIDPDPFTVFYSCENISRLDQGNGIYDTAFINELIRNNELEKYFEKLK